ncbi:MAG: response regulator [Bdellovibrionales bacterium]|nr:response regulator [Bdellovibrionales bacterium]
MENQPKLDGLRILLADDDQSALEAIGIYLRSFGAEVMAVESACEAIKSMPSFKPNVLVSDIAMPGEDGYSLIRKVRNLKLAQGGDVPALALTAYATADDTKRILAAGFQAHMAKPVEANSLGRVILDISGQKINKD